MFKNIEKTKYDYDNHVLYIIHDIKFQIKGKKVSPILHVKPATQNNAKYFERVMEAQKEANKTITEDDNNIYQVLFDTRRDLARKQFPGPVIVGWDKSTIIDDAGNEVEFTEEVCAEFLKAIPDDFMDKLIEYCTTPANFINGFIDVETASKN